MPDLNTTIAAIVSAAKAWQDPEFAPRSEAAHATLSAPNRFTEEAVAFAINQHMNQLASPKKLHAWIDGERGTANLEATDLEAADVVPVGVVAEGTVPLASVRGLVGVWLAGHRPVVRVAEASRHLLRAFADTVAAEGGPATAFAVDDAHLLASSEALLIEGDEDVVADWAAQAESAGIDSARRYERARSITIGVIDGTEEFEERIGLAEDVLLHEGMSASNVALLWAPTGLDPDPYFDAFSGFRQVMPAHPGTDGVLEMPRAFLKAAGQSYAWGDGVLVSRGDPQVQTAGHLRWAEYDAPSSVTGWIERHRDALGGIVATKRVAERFGLADALHVRPGNAHRARLGNASEARLMAFLLGL